MSPERPWHCAQIPNGVSPIVVCQREDLLVEVETLRAEVDRLRSAVGAGLDELRDEHRQAADGIGCVTCYPSDGRWPCTSALIADALAAALSGEHPEPPDAYENYVDEIISAGRQVDEQPQDPEQQT